MEKKNLKVTVKRQAAVNLFNFGSLLLSYQLLIRGGENAAANTVALICNLKKAKKKKTYSGTCY